MKRRRLFISFKTNTRLETFYVFVCLFIVTIVQVNLKQKCNGYVYYIRDVSSGEIAFCWQAFRIQNRKLIYDYVMLITLEFLLMWISLTFFFCVCVISSLSFPDFNNYVNMFHNSYRKNTAIMIFKFKKISLLYKSFLYCHLFMVNCR